MLEYYHAKDMIVMITNTMILKTFSFDASFEVCTKTVECVRTGSTVGHTYATQCMYQWCLQKSGATTLLIFGDCTYFRHMIIRS